MKNIGSAVFCPKCYAEVIACREDKYKPEMEEMACVDCGDFFPRYINTRTKRCPACRKKRADRLCAIRKETVALVQKMKVEAGEKAALEYLRKLGRRSHVVQIATIPKIQRATAAYFNISVADMIERDQSSPYVIARQTSMYLCREMTSHSLLMIGQSHGLADHTTVLYAIKRAKNRANIDYEAIKNAILQKSAEGTGEC
jgi:chromosomal replication initiation ATPase DnaA